MSRGQEGLGTSVYAQVPGPGGISAKSGVKLPRYIIVQGSDMVWSLHAGKPSSPHVAIAEDWRPLRDCTLQLFRQLIVFHCSHPSDNPVARLE